MKQRPLLKVYALVHWPSARILNIYSTYVCAMDRMCRLHRREWDEHNKAIIDDNEAGLKEPDLGDYSVLEFSVKGMRALDEKGRIHINVAQIEEDGE